MYITYFCFFLLSCPETNKQVIVWIHGGAFIFGGIGVYNPEYIMEENVVLVTIQYRLNIFGFLSTEDSAAPGNYGKSMKKNIQTRQCLA